MTPARQSVREWVEEIGRLTKPERVVWLDGSEQEYRALLADGVRDQQLIPLHPDRHPGSYLHRSHPQDVARTEQCTYLCTPTSEEAGPTNNWMAPEEARAKLHRLFDGAMRGRVMYVIPYLLGPAGGALTRVGVELTDSVYVAINMRIMTRMGEIALAHLGSGRDYVQGVHSIGTLDPAQRYICHFPQECLVYSINSGYGGNAILSKKCVALRLGSWLGREEGWLAEHMMVMGIEDPQGRITYFAGAFPSACGKTNLAMLRPPARFASYRIWCLGDDIAWLRPGADGRLYAINPETGFFGVAPGTSEHTNPHMMRTIARNTIFTNVALRPDRTVWWEGLDVPADTDGWLDWQGRPWHPGLRQPAAHPNARFTAPLQQCPVASPRWDDPQGVPISAIIFGSRRSTLVPLVHEGFHWQHGVYLGATLSSETTAAAAGATGVVRRDPMAMRPFCGYNMADYFAHWLALGARLLHPPRMFRVNWFRKDERGQFLWPGFGENLRIMTWMADRCEGRAEAVSTPIGYLPTPEMLDTEGLAVSREAWRQLLAVDRDGWLEAAARQSEFFNSFGARLPAALREEQRLLIQRLHEMRAEPASST